MRRAWQVAVLLLQISTCWAIRPAAEAANGGGAEAILVFSSYRQGYEWSDREIDGIHLKRYDIPFESLPPETVVINRPVSSYEQYKAGFWALLSALSVLAALVCILVILLIRNQTARERLREGERNFSTILDTVADPIFVKDQELSCWSTRPRASY